MYVVTGVLTNGRRFKAMYFQNYLHASMINLHRGSIWYEDKNGNRTLLRRVGW